MEGRHPAGGTEAEEKLARLALEGGVVAVPHTLLTAGEVRACLGALGAADVAVIVPPPPGDLGLGSGTGTVVATGRSGQHLRVLADGLARALRARNLQDRGVVGAVLGPEGGGGGEDGWVVVDCGNWIVHLQDEASRRHLDLEGLWGGGEAGRALRAVDLGDDDAVDEYCAANPVPDGYARDGLRRAAGAGLPDFGRRGRGERWNPGKKMKKGRRGRRTSQY